MFPRRHLNEILDLLGRNPAVALLGPRQAGKTTLAIEISKTRPSTYLDLERPRDLAKLSDPELFFATHARELVILDEVQRAPDLFMALRGIIDERRREGHRTGQFLFLGSASMDLLKQSGESLAGRIAYTELGPLDALEVPVADDAPAPTRLDGLWLRGGFPESFLAADERASFEWRRDFIRTYLERDIPQLGPRVPAETLRRFWTMLAHNQGAMLNTSRLASGLGVSGRAVGRYLDLLVDLLLVRRLQPWAANAGKRLIKSPKVYVRDSGVVHSLLGIETMDQLLGHPVIGPSWEGFVVENLLAAVPRFTPAYFYRTSAGAEIDLVLELAPGERVAVEVKRTSAPKLGKGFVNACEDLDIDRRYIVYPGIDRFPLDVHTEAIGLRELMTMLS